jgi:uncharacterized protein YggE
VQKERRVLRAQAEAMQREIEEMVRKGAEAEDDFRTTDLRTNATRDRSKGIEEIAGRGAGDAPR